MDFFIEVHTSQLIKHNEELCGDTIEVVRTDNSFIVVLSDGLGSGVKANILATLTSKIASTMLKSGGELEDVVDTITKTLPVCKVRNLAYSTFSILQIFHTGEVYLVEFDNPPLFFIRENHIQALPSTSREINGLRIRETRFQSRVDDMYTIVSDGVIHAGIGGRIKLGWQRKNVEDALLNAYSRKLSSRAITARIATICSHYYNEKPGDDTSIVSIQIKKPIYVNIFSGPPENSTEDPHVVHTFMQSPGKKIICGGTTANIVARELSRSLRTDIHYIDPYIPPTAAMDGIDLITEGVLTLNHTLQIIQEYLAACVPPEEFEPICKKNGAAHLARILLTEATHVNFWIGKTVNTAHQRIDIGIRVHIIEKLVEQLQQMGLCISSKYY